MKISQTACIMANRDGSDPARSVWYWVKHRGVIVGCSLEPGRDLVATVTDDVVKLEDAGGALLYMDGTIPVYAVATTVPKAVNRGPA